MTLDEIQWEPLVLAADVRRQGNLELREVVSVGRVETERADVIAARDGVELTPAIKASRLSHAYWQVTIPISIRRRDNVKIDLLRVGVQLAPALHSIVWAMDPLQVTQDVKVETSTKLDANLEIQSVKVGPEVSRSKEYIELMPVIEAYGLRESVSGWEFRPAAGRALGGIQLLKAVIQVPKSRPCAGQVSITADVDQTGWLLSYRALSSDNSEAVARFDLIA